jgi:hypothetical protein
MSATPASLGIRALIRGHHPIIAARRSLKVAF